MHRLPTIPVVLLYSYCIIFCCILPYQILCWYYIGYCNTECVLLSMLLRKPPCMYPALCLRIPSQEVGVESIERIPRNNLMCDGTNRWINGWYLIGWCDILINYSKCNYFWITITSELLISSSVGMCLTYLRKWGENDLTGYVPISPPIPQGNLYFQAHRLTHF